MNKALAGAIIVRAAPEKEIIDQFLLDMNSRKMSAADFVDLTIASFSSSAARPAETCGIRGANGSWKTGDFILGQMHS
jgi:hypothetical protein